MHLSWVFLDTFSSAHIKLQKSYGICVAIDDSCTWGEEVILLGCSHVSLVDTWPMGLDVGLDIASKVLFLHPSERMDQGQLVTSLWQEVLVSLTEYYLQRPSLWVFHTDILAQMRRLVKKD